MIEAWECCREPVHAEGLIHILFHCISHMIVFPRPIAFRSALDQTCFKFIKHEALYAVSCKEIRNEYGKFSDYIKLMFYDKLQRIMIMQTSITYYDVIRKPCATYGNLYLGTQSEDKFNF
jgi:hypothetical protein